MLEMMENIQYYKTFSFDQASDHDTVIHTCDNILAHSAIVESSRLCDAASNRANNLFSNSAPETKVTTRYQQYRKAESRKTDHCNTLEDLQQQPPTHGSH
jgi:hypothetical protein